MAAWVVLAIGPLAMDIVGCLLEVAWNEGSGRREDDFPFFYWFSRTAVEM